jgi:mannose-6-phosphate isomerase-like protein (cupin superfamily)
LRQLDRYALELPALGRTLHGKAFLKEALGLTGMEVSATCLPAGEGTAIIHHHQEHEELYFFVQGRGQMQVDGETFDVEEGSAVRVAAGGVRAIRASVSEPVVFLCVQARERSMPTAEAYTDGVVDGKPSWPR